jgi:hypothetical protein
VNGYAQRGIRRLVDPFLHAVLRISGVDSREDLDDARLQKRWADGKRFLRQALVDVAEESNVGGSGFMLYGRRP